MKNLKKLVDECRGIKVLYAEDEEDIREQMLAIFSMIFSTIDTASNGLEALEMYEANSYDLLLTDINMPCMNGLELIAKIREESEKQKVIIISAYNESNLLLKTIGNL